MLLDKVKIYPEGGMIRFDREDGTPFSSKSAGTIGVEIREVDGVAQALFFYDNVTNAGIVRVLTFTDVLDAANAPYGSSLSEVLTAINQFLGFNKGGGGDSSLIGEVKLFAGVAIPTGWAKLEGQLFTVAQYPELYAVLGNSFGGTAGVNFNLPDMRGRIPVGGGLYTFGPLPADEIDYLLGDAGGAHEIGLSVAEMPEHRHTVRAFTGSGNSSSPTNSLLADTAAFDFEYSNTDAPDTNMRTEMLDNAGSGSAHENRQPYTVLNYIINLG